ncbi:uncharacterized protein TNCT_391191 [Trichonephila clavata]|uniref:Uncharacterized protein n=1 Tax=Trichonephila clavata TaxID=2740835 RepID=A0A8X6JLT6_TRICU|nr:uncharacterized protein TNCT_391191 [Trichonephila clavata]
MSVEQRAEDKTTLSLPDNANECSKETEFKEDKAGEQSDKKCNKTPKNTRKSLVTLNECMGAPKEELKSKRPQEKEIKTFSLEKISKELIHYYKTEQLKTPKNSTKDCMNAMKSLTIDKSCKISEKKGNNTTLRKTSPNPNAFQESKDISPKIQLPVKPKDSAHSGMTFKPKVMKETIPKPFKFQSTPKVLSRSKSATDSKAGKK